MQRVAIIGLSSVALMLGLPLLCYTVRNTGPAARVVFYEYFPIIELGFYVVATGLGAAIGFELGRALTRRRPEPSSPARLIGYALGSVLLAIWALGPTLQAFPADAGLAERDAWARRHVRYYASLTRVIAALPDVQRDIGHVFAMAPTAHDQHRWAVEMNGDDMRFTLELKGARGMGTLAVDCTLDDDRIYDWRAAQWHFNGEKHKLTTVLTRIPRY